MKDFPLLSFLEPYLNTYLTVFFIVMWLSLVIWTYRDISRRTDNNLGRLLAVLITAILFVPGWLIYLLLRPTFTADEEYTRTLKEESLLQSIEDVPNCPGCNKRTQPDWIICPRCQTKLKKRCTSCGKLQELKWDICPYCGTTAAGVWRDKMSVDEALQSLPKSPSQSKNPFNFK